MFTLAHKAKFKFESTGIIRPIFTGHNIIKTEINNQKKSRKTYEYKERLAERRNHNGKQKISRIKKY